MKFGFLTSSKRIKSGGISIAPLPEFGEIIANFYETASVSEGWIYGPEREEPKSAEEKSRFKNTAPKIAQPFFRLPSTHEITSTDLDDDQLKFVVLAYGFLNGLYLTPENYACLQKAPYQEGKLSRLVLGGSDYEIGIRKIRQFLLNSGKEKVHAMRAILHWFLAGQSYEFEWDRFDAQYKVLDGIYAVSGISSPFHARRPVDLVAHFARYKIILPDWCKIDKPKSSKVSRMRNDLFHEAIYAGMPLGYAYPDENYDLEFVSFNAKLIAALLTIDTPYLRAAPDDRSQWLWKMK
jgi:hypothetical protein